MLTAFLRAFRTPDLRKKLLFTVGIIALFRFGAAVPTPGISEKAISACAGVAASGSSAGVYQLINLLSGNALLRMSVFALGIMPYITASIILQLLTVVIPRLEQLKQEGQAGQAKITQYTRYLTIGLGVLQSTGYVELARSGKLYPQCTQSLIPNSSVFTIVTMVITMVSGTAVIMWMGELITDRGVGNGMSILIFTQVIAVIPGGLLEIFRTKKTFITVITVIVLIAIVAFVVFMEQAQRRVPVQYAKRMGGRRMYGGTSTYLPLKVNQAGVIPVIFASSLIYIPHLITQLVRSGSGGVGNSWWDKFVGTYLSDPSDPVYICIYFGLIIFFTYFYVSITFNPDERADEMKKFGGFIPGIRPGKPTADYLRYVLSRITLRGSIYLGVIAVLPNLFLQIGNGGGVQNLPFGGTAVLIMIGVGLDTVKQIESQLMQRNYEGFLK